MNGTACGPIHLSVNRHEIAGRAKPPGRMMATIREPRPIRWAGRLLTAGLRPLRGARFLPHLWGAGFSG